MLRLQVKINNTKDPPKQSNIWSYFWKNPLKRNSKVSRQHTMSNFALNLVIYSL